MTSLDRAKHFLARRSKTIALTIVPLAGLVISQTPAKAVIQPLTALTPGGCGVSPIGSNVSASGGDCSDVAQSSPDAGGLLGVKLYTTDSSFSPSPITAFSGSGGTFGLEIYASGGTTGTLYSASVPVAWDFTVTTGDAGNFSYLLTYDLFGSPGGSFSTGSLSSFTNTSGTTISGTNSIGLTTGTVTGYSVELEVEESAGFGPSESLTVNVPTSSLDLAAAAATPEPGSIFLFGSGLAAVLLRRLRRVRS